MYPAENETRLAGHQLLSSVLLDHLYKLYRGQEDELTDWPPLKTSFLDCLDLKIKALQFFETSENIYPNTRRSIPQNFHIQ